jgi:hypothetical protein
MPEQNDLLGLDTSVDFLEIKRNDVLNRELNSTFSLLVRTTRILQALAMNRSVLSVLNGSPQRELWHWVGPLIAFGWKGRGQDPSGSRDLDMLDFRHVVDKFQCRQIPGPPDSPQVIYTPPQTNLSATSETIYTPISDYSSRDEYRVNRWQQAPSSATSEVIYTPVSSRCDYMPHTPHLLDATSVLAVHIACASELANGRPKFSTVSIPAHSSIFILPPTSDVSRFINFPFIAQRAPDAPRYPHCKDTTYEGTNAEAYALHTGCHPDTVGTFAEVWNGESKAFFGAEDLGSVVVVRKDRGPLHPELVEALYTWSRVEVPRLLRNITGCSGVTPCIVRDIVARQITRERFVAYYEGWLAGKEIEGKELENLRLDGKSTGWGSFGPSRDPAMRDLGPRLVSSAVTAVIALFLLFVVAQFVAPLLLLMIILPF